MRPLAPLHIESPLRRNRQTISSGDPNYPMHTTYSCSSISCCCSSTDDVGTHVLVFVPGSSQLKRLNCPTKSSHRSMTEVWFRRARPASGWVRSRQDPRLSPAPGRCPGRCAPGRTDAALASLHREELGLRVVSSPRISIGPAGC